MAGRPDAGNAGAGERRPRPDQRRLGGAADQQPRGGCRCRHPTRSAPVSGASRFRFAVTRWASIRRSWRNPTGSFADWSRDQPLLPRACTMETRSSVRCRRIASRARKVANWSFRFVGIDESFRSPISPGVKPSIRGSGSGCLIFRTAGVHCEHDICVIWYNHRRHALQHDNANVATASIMARRSQRNCIAAGLIRQDRVEVPRLIPVNLDRNIAPRQPLAVLRRDEGTTVAMRLNYAPEPQAYRR